MPWGPKYWGKAYVKDPTMEELTNHVADGLKFVCVAYSLQAYSLQTDTICKQRSAQHSTAQLSFPYVRVWDGAFVSGL